MPKDRKDWPERWTNALTILGFVMLVVILLGMFAACLKMGHSLTR